MNITSPGEEQKRQRMVGNQSTPPGASQQPAAQRDPSPKQMHVHIAGSHSPRHWNYSVPPTQKRGTLELSCPYTYRGSPPPAEPENRQNVVKNSSRFPMDKIPSLFCVSLPRLLFCFVFSAPVAGFCKSQMDTYSKGSKSYLGAGSKGWGENPCGLPARADRQSNYFFFFFLGGGGGGEHGCGW